MKVNLRPFAVALALLAAAGCTSNPPALPVDAGDTDLGVVDVAMDVAPDVPFRCTANTMCTSQPGRPLCDVATGACVSCAQMATACTAAQFCNAATGACEAGCSSDTGCAGGAGDGGVGPTHCDTLTHACVQCVTDDHCPSGTLCRGSACVMGCNAGRACPTNQSCCDGACLDTASNVAACGTCGTVCRTANGRPACSGGLCTLGTCTAPYDNCDMNVANGCESNTQSDPMHCGACETACEVHPNATATCAAGVCGSQCDTGFADCDGDASNGCEVDTRVTPANCGRCGRVCPAVGGTAVCADGVCGIGVCGMGFENCDGLAANGCETNVNTSTANCGRCGTVAPARANATATCVAGVAGIECEPGFGDCDGDASNGCEVNLNNTVAHCGGCATVCPVGPGAAAACVGGECGLTCASGRGDCDGMASTGCEVDLNTNISNCRACGTACVAGPSSMAACAAGVCSITCATGFADCDRTAANGCEIETRVSQTNCGGCGRVCPTGQVCNDSVCVLPCEGVRTRCSGSCVSLLTDNSNCGACGAACATGTTCTDGVCRCTLAGGAALSGVSCGTACVDVLSDTANCGACGNACGTGNTCVRGVCRCTVSGAPIGITCGGVCADPIADPANCGRCGNACASGETCIIGVCRCASGGLTCSGTCVDPTADRANCGACGRACAAGQECASSVCRTCGTGQSLCGSTCVTLSGDNNNCGTCGMVCASGSSCISGRCTGYGFTRGTLPFVDACAASGATTRILAGVDDSVGAALTVPFTFSFFGVPYTTVRPSSNGYIVFGSTSEEHDNNYYPGMALPDPSRPRPAAFAYNSDLYQRTTAGICYATVGATPNRRSVVEWLDAAMCCGDTGAQHFTFESILNEADGSMDFVYATMTTAGTTSAFVVGVQNATALAGSTFEYNGSGAPTRIMSNMSLHVAALP